MSDSKAADEEPTTITIRVPAWLKSETEKIRRRRGLTLSGAVRLALEDFVRKNRLTPP